MDCKICMKLLLLVGAVLFTIPAHAVSKQDDDTSGIRQVVLPNGRHAHIINGNQFPVTADSTKDCAFECGTSIPTLLCYYHSGLSHYDILCLSAVVIETTASIGQEEVARIAASLAVAKDQLRGEGNRYLRKGEIPVLKSADRDIIENVYTNAKANKTFLESINDGGIIATDVMILFTETSISIY